MVGEEKGVSIRAKLTVVSAVKKRGLRLRGGYAHSLQLTKAVGGTGREERKGREYRIS